MLAAVVYLTLGALLARFVPRRRVKAFFVTTAMILVFLVGIARVHLGVHYPSDVLGGWSAGLALGPGVLAGRPRAPATRCHQSPEVSRH